MCDFWQNEVMSNFFLRWLCLGSHLILSHEVSVKGPRNQLAWLHLEHRSCLAHWSTTCPTWMWVVRMSCSECWQDGDVASCQITLDICFLLVVVVAAAVAIAVMMMMIIRGTDDVFLIHLIINLSMCFLVLVNAKNEDKVCCWSVIQVAVFELLFILT